MKKRNSMAGLLALVCSLLLTSIGLSAQNARNVRPVEVAQGQKTKVQGVISIRDGDMFKVRDPAGAETTVLLTANTKVSTHNRGLRGKKAYPVTYIMRGLRVQSEGKGDAEGRLVADWVRFDEDDLHAAQSLEQTAELAEENAARLAASEENARKLAAQIEENTALANAARARANEANAKADAAMAMANQAFKDAAMANNRINGLDNYETIRSIPVLFKVNSAVLNASAKQSIDEAAAWAKAEKAKGNTNGWLCEVVGFADTTGKTAKNRALSERRAKTVIDYLVIKHDLDLRRLVQPFGYGDQKPIASNKTASGRAQNRRVEIRVLQNKGIANKAQ